MIKWNRHKIFLFGVILFYTLSGYAQEDLYSVELMPFSSRYYDDYAPLIMDDGVLFCSNRKLNIFVDYKNLDDTRLFNILMVEKKDSVKWNSPEIFSKDLTTVFNEGPASYCKLTQTLFFTRNLSTDKKNIKGENSYGIFYTVLSQSVLMSIREFPFNSNEYKIAHPSISEDGNTLYFSSDMPDGYGQSDIWVSRYQRGVWSEPENLGSNVNSSSSELYPFLYSNNRLYFSSDNGSSMGGLDIFYTTRIDSVWTKPIRMESPINSPSDDFSFTADTSLASGYFASNRGSSKDNIYHFVNAMPSLVGCGEQSENKYCYLFSDRGIIDLDTVPNVVYQWDLGDSTIKNGLKVKHCYEKEGSYPVSLSIVDTLGGDIYFVQASYLLEAFPVEQVYIKSVDTCYVGEPVAFEENSYLPGVVPEEYYWDFDDGNLSSLSRPGNIFDTPGSYNVRLVIKGLSDSKDAKQEFCSYKKIVVIERKLE